MTDTIINARDLPLDVYREKKIGPRFRVYRESDFNFLLDEVKTVCAKTDSPFPDKDYLKGKKVLVEYFDTKTPDEIKDGVEVDWKHGETLLSMLENIGVRALRDYPNLTVILGLLRTHYNEMRGDDVIGDEL